MDYKSRLLHTGHDIDPYTGAASIPIYQVSTFAQSEDVIKKGYMYARKNNPTRDSLEGTIALLEGGEMGFAFASGMAAISSVFLLFQPGDHVVVSDDVYGGTYRVLTTLFKRWRLESTFADVTTPESIRAALKPNTRAIFAETPSNPILRITDLRGVVAVAREKGLVSIIDNTFMTPYLQRPLELGFDVVIHSATKFLGGHSDLIAGLVVTAGRELGREIENIQVGFGAVLGPMDSWLLSRGIKTLPARMDAQQHNAGIVADWLTRQDGVQKVCYPTLDGHEGKEVHLSQSSGGGAVVSFDLGDSQRANAFIRSVKLPLFAVSLGGVESILSYPSLMSHSSMPREERLARGIGDGLLRLSVGLEDPGDLCDDFARALELIAL